MTPPHAAPGPAFLKYGRAYERRCRGRRRHPVVLHLGTFPGPYVEVEHVAAYDAGLRADLLERLLDDCDPTVAVPWFTRGGALSPGDDDLGWYAAAASAYGRHGHRVSAFYLITRHGWLDLVSEQTGRWRGAAS